MKHRDLVMTRPVDIKPGDTFGVKVVAIFDEGGYSWAAYRGPTSWTDEHVASRGAKILREAAELLFYALAASDHPYRD